MPIIKSAKKRVKIAAKANARNTRTRRDLRDALKAFAAALESGKTDSISKTQVAAAKAIDTAAKKNVLHKNKAARKKAQLATQAKAKGAKPFKSTVKKTVTKAPAKKTATKKATKK